MRLPVDMLLPQLGAILEGMLIWAEDSKNKFKLKVGSRRKVVSFTAITHV